MSGPPPSLSSFSILILVECKNNPLCCDMCTLPTEPGVGAELLYVLPVYFLNWHWHSVVGRLYPSYCSGYLDISTAATADAIITWRIEKLTYED
jgi:hypothetical protein